MSFLDSKYNSSYGVREERNSSGNTYYDRNGDSHYDRSDAVRSNQIILKDSIEKSIDSDDSCSIEKKQTSQPRKPKKKKEFIPLTPAEQAFFDSLEEKYEEVTGFVNDQEFSISDFISGAAILKIPIPIEILLEFHSHKGSGLLGNMYSMHKWETVLSKPALSLVEEIKMSATDRYEELFPYVIEGVDFKSLM